MGSSTLGSTKREETLKGWTGTRGRRQGPRGSEGDEERRPERQELKLKVVTVLSITFYVLKWTTFFIDIESVGRSTRGNFIT